MKVAVITPVGPGHESVYVECQKSIASAWAKNQGPFKDLILIPQWDLEGSFGRSERRNSGIQQAKDMGCDWLFFLDADDIMTPFAFEDVGKYTSEYDAIWGYICETQFNDASNIKLRENQLRPTAAISDILTTDPFLSIQMGHFVKTSVAVKVGFDESMDTGEDFKYYLSVWRFHKACKTSGVFFVNVRGNHSHGPRSANGRDWRIAVEREIANCKTQLIDTVVSSRLDRQLRNFKANTVSQVA